MQIILKEDIQNVGFKDDLVEVKNGYGRNFLIPKGKAVLATISAKKVLKENLKQRAFKEEKVIKEAKSFGNKLMKIEMKLPSKISTGDRLFGSVTVQDLVSFFDSKGETVEKKLISIPGRSIKRTGKYEASIRLHRDVSIQFPFEIIAQA
jgi:large subunit ribosomal protein L9|tara:strand:+ start:14470 stop:14919 length:450 start_codon:yes stop_codon:yes gene_type:complete